MLMFTKKSAARKNYSDCSGCSLCLLVCPVWRQSRDISLTPHGFAKAMQHGTSAAASAEHCTLCMACEPVCPENIDIIGMILELRRQLDVPAWMQELQARMEDRSACEAALAPVRAIDETTSHSTKLANNASQVAGYRELPLLLPDQALHEHPGVLARIAALLGTHLSEDDGSDISQALESGAAISEQRLQRFLAPLRPLKKIIVADGLLLRHLKQWLPNTNIIGLGEALSGLADVRSNLHETDLYVIEPRAYHSDYQRLVKHYDRLKAESGSAFNLDLQRIAIPATARNLPQRLGLTASNDDGQTRWVLLGRNVTRIVVESLEEREVFERISDVPVMHLAELADRGVM